ncbi:DUF2953 domain-containing protein [Bacillus tuaregi]|uniref:DUF2953 domain-containing protein n=1 Tax=Bacillus tuaregi TaxID=1816695 RepID=UPI0008F93219|nr:DUF2953 domain-containing protein [Bacillus tuaregi]
MKWILVFCLVILLLFIIIIVTKLRVIISYFHAQDDDSLKIEFKALFGLIKYKLDIPVIKIDDDSAAIVTKEKLKSGKEEKTKKEGHRKMTPDDLIKSYYDFKMLLEHVVSLHKIIRRFLKKVKIIEFEWNTLLGTGDAALTGMLTGAAWSIKGAIIGIISSYFKLQVMPQMNVQPHFQMAVTQTSFKCMLQFRIGHAMVAGIQLLKFWKGGRPKFKSKPLSALTNDKTKPF